VGAGEIAGLARAASLILTQVGGGGGAGAVLTKPANEEVAEEEGDVEP
jgi:hypothetical protein